MSSKYPPSSNLNYGAYDHSDPDATIEDWLDQIITDGVQAVVDLNADVIPLPALIAAYERTGWAVATVDLSGVSEDNDVNRRLAATLKWPDFVSASIDAWSSWLRIGLEDISQAKACLILDVRAAGPWSTRERLHTATLDTARHMRSVFGKTFQQGGTNVQVHSFIWYESFASRTYSQRDPGFVIRPLAREPDSGRHRGPDHI